MGKPENTDLTAAFRKGFSCGELSTSRRERTKYATVKAAGVRSFLDGNFDDARTTFDVAGTSTDSLEERIAMCRMSLECGRRMGSEAYKNPAAAAEEFRKRCRDHSTLIKLQETPDNYLSYMEFLGQEMPKAGAYMVPEAIKVGEIALSVFPEDARLHAAMHELYTLAKGTNSEYEDKAHECMVNACRLKFDDPDFLIAKFGKKIWEKKSEGGGMETMPFVQMMKHRKNEAPDNAAVMHKYGHFMLENAPETVPMAVQFLFKAYILDQSLPGIKGDLAKAYEKGLAYVRANPEFDISSGLLFMLRQIKSLADIKGKMPSELEMKALAKSSDSDIEVPPPRRIKEWLDEYIIGQERAKRIIAVGLYSHAVRVTSIGEKGAEDEDEEMKKSNILLLGPTGCGKTYTAITCARILAKMLGRRIPFTVSDASKITDEGIWGSKADEPVRDLYFVAGKDLEQTQKGVIFLDEIDKRKATEGGGHDVGGQGAQQQMLKPVEGSIVNVRLSRHGDSIPIDTTNILFIAGGAFSKSSSGESLTEKVAKSKGGKLGFGAQGNELKTDELLEAVTPQDLIDYGFLPEFVARFPIRAPLYELTRDELQDILTKPKGAVLRHYRRLFREAKIRLEVTEDARQAIAEAAQKLKQGARSLNSVCEVIFNNMLYEMVGGNATELVVDGDFVINHWKKKGQ
ncbi:MAG TPA: AAA domain-containing protein [Nanoarchaeota archaeon]|nr:AAA domain-containing protein [Nanoarchaeota archaeon]